MRQKNSWNKSYVEIERRYKVRDEKGKIVKDENGDPVIKIEKGTIMTQGGLKPSDLERNFRKAIKNIKVEKPKSFKGDWVWGK